MNNKILNLIGIARRAGKVSIGHDASVTDLKSGKAKLCLLSSSASQRLKDEMAHLCEMFSSEIIVSAYTMEELGASLGTKSIAVLTVNDEGFAKRITELTREE